MDEFEAPAGQVWRYVGPDIRVFSDIPVTVRPGDRLQWPGYPGIGWEAADDGEEPTVVPDNTHRIWTEKELTRRVDGVWSPALQEHWEVTDNA
jgi:hypothetical protein